MRRFGGFSRPCEVNDREAPDPRNRRIRATHTTRHGSVLVCGTGLSSKHVSYWETLVPPRESTSLLAFAASNSPPSRPRLQPTSLRQVRPEAGRGRTHRGSQKHREGRCRKPPQALRENRPDGGPSKCGIGGVPPAPSIYEGPGSRGGEFSKTVGRWVWCLLHGRKKGRSSYCRWSPVVLESQT